MSTKICIVHHSGYGHTAKQAAAVAEGIRRIDGVECVELTVADLEDAEAAGWSELDEAAAIVFGSPTYMGSASADMKRFMEATSGRWMEQKWADKLAAGFTNSGSQNGDKQNTLVSFLTLAAQHGMVWVNLNLLPGNNSSKGSVDDVNRLGGSLGAMAQSNVDEGPDVCPPEADLETARRLGQRVAECTLRWNRG
ncbi:flavodoxin family protein [Lentisalinibacter orientalis]|uniref:flavodoxin family protein n=1 Tax=Lentisalinibacter orientalis TaxID=2992241 RepID=UPI0038664055